MQTFNVISKLNTYLKATIHLFVGGTSVQDDIKKLKKGIQVVVGTPGRVFDMLDRKHLTTGSLKMFILDEADEMLSRGFKE
jgi:translation initiation factor 4A